MKTEETKTYYQQRYDIFNNLGDRTMIKIFDTQYGHKGVFPTLVELGLARYSDRYPEGAIDENRISEVNDVMDKFKACNDLIKMDDFIQRQNKMRIETL